MSMFEESRTLFLTIIELSPSRAFEQCSFPVPFITHVRHQPCGPISFRWPRNNVSAPFKPMSSKTSMNRNKVYSISVVAANSVSFSKKQPMHVCLPIYVLVPMCAPNGTMVAYPYGSIKCRIHLSVPAIPLGKRP